MSKIIIKKYLAILDTEQVIAAIDMESAKKVAKEIFKRRIDDDPDVIIIVEYKQ